MAIGPAITELDILNQVIGPDRSGLAPEAARSLLAMKFDEAATGRIRDLLIRNQSAQLSEAEQEELQRYLRVGQLLDLLHAKANLALQA